MFKPYPHGLANDSQYNRQSNLIAWGACGAAAIAAAWGLYGRYGQQYVVDLLAGGRFGHFIPRLTVDYPDRWLLVAVLLVVVAAIAAVVDRYVTMKPVREYCEKVSASPEEKRLIELFTGRGFKSWAISHEIGHVERIESQDVNGQPKVREKVHPPIVQMVGVGADGIEVFLRPPLGQNKHDLANCWNTRANLFGKTEFFAEDVDGENRVFLYIFTREGGVDDVDLDVLDGGEL